MAINCKICNKELDAFSGGRCKICRELVCSECISSGSTEKKSGIICKNCSAPQNKAEKRTESSESKDEIQESTSIYGISRVSLLIFGCFTLLCIFIYLVTTPYLTTRNALQIVEFGPEEKLEKAKDDLASETGSYVLDELEDMVKNGKRNTAIRAVQALGAQPNPKAVLILKQLQLSDDCPEYLKSVIIEALLDNERRYKNITEIEK